MHPERVYFEKLKEAIVAAYRLSHLEAPDKIEEWTGKTIEGFQEDLVQKGLGRISTKWFYTHIKSGDVSKLPRIDVLNLLSEYAAAKDWADFVQTQKAKGVRPGKKKSKMLLPALIVMILALVLMAYQFNMESKKMECSFCFVDADLGEAITTHNLEFVLLKDHESPLILSANEKGCVQFETQDNKITAIVKANYYHTDTIIREISAGHTEEYKLRLDDYALMIHLFSNSETEGWQKRRSQLQEIIKDDARIYQVYPQNQRGMEIFNKTEFIDKLTMPLQSLNNIRVLETEYKEGKISAMRIVQDNKSTR